MSPVPLLALTTPDGIVLALMGYFALRGLLKGFVWQLLRTGGLIMGFGLGAAYGEQVGAFLANRFSWFPQGALWGWGAIAFATFVVVTMLAHLLREAVREANLSSTDRVLGLGLGAVLGLFIAVFGFTFWAGWRPASEVKETLAGSHTMVWMAKFIDVATPLFPEGIRDQWSSLRKNLS